MKTVLIFRSAALGDFIMTSPAFSEVRKSFPGYHVLLLTILSADKSQRDKVLRYVGDIQSAPWVDMVKPHLIDEVITLRSTSDIRYLWSLRKSLKSYRIETAIIMSDIWAPLLGRWMKWLLLRVLIGSVPLLGWRGAASAGKLKKLGLLKHHVHGPLKFLSEMKPSRAYADKDLIFDLRPGQDSADWVSYWLKENGLTDGIRLVAVAPGSIQPHKRWPIDSFKELIESIIAKYTDVQVIIIGTPMDKELGRLLKAISPHRINNLAGVTSIAQSGAFLQRCSLLVGNDGGAMHLGDSMGCKVVSIIPGIEYPDSIEPWHNKELAVRHPVECSPCYNFLQCPQGHNRCMTELPVEKVLERCIFVLDQK